MGNFQFFRSQKIEIKDEELLSALEGSDEEEQESVICISITREEFNDSITKKIKI